MLIIILIIIKFIQRNIQFIYYCFKNNNQNNILLIVWDLGFSKDFLRLMKIINNHYKNVIYKKYNYSQYPHYFNMKTKVFCDINKYKCQLLKVVTIIDLIRV